jgi:hypothetical protein
VVVSGVVIGGRGNTIRDLPVIVLTTKRARTGNLRKSPLMGVEHDGNYLIVVSVDGAPKYRSGTSTR